MAKNNKKGQKGNVFKVAGAKSLKKTKAKAVNLGLKNANLQTSALHHTPPRSKSKRRLGQPLKYQRRPGCRPYIDYTQKDLEECLAAVRSKKLSQRDASDYYNIPRSTIKNKIAKKNCNKPGRQPIFSAEEEELFVSRIATLSEFGFPLTNYDFKMVIKDYLTSQNKTVTIFRNNLPGKDWVKYFFDRHEDLCEHLEYKSERTSNQLTESVITDFIDHVSSETKDVPPQNIYTYYEISLRDDPTRKTVVCRRGVKYLETTVVQAAKAKFSVMFCGNAVGETIPPYIIYKAEPGCSTWTENGPQGARYNCTKCGWMDSVTFESWFTIHLLPVLQKRSGRKILIGDYLTSHINGTVLNLCEKYNIRFVCLPYKANHILQPLHTAYFRPLRLMWTQLLLDWQSSQIAKKLPTTLKEDFPFLLQKALNALTDTSQNIIIGFEKSGIFPIDKEEPLYRLPISHHRVIDNHMLKPTDYECDTERLVSQDEIISSEIIPKEEFESSASGTDMLEENLDALNVVDGDVYIIVVQGDEVLQIPLQDIDTTSQEKENPLDITVGDHVLVTHGNHNYPGKVLAIAEQGAYVHCMKRWKSLWRWPSIMREQLYSWEEIVCKIDVPKLAKRGCFVVPEIDRNQ